MIKIKEIMLGNFGDDGGELEKVGRRYNIPVLFGIVEPGLLYNAKLDAPLWGKSLFPNLTCHEESTVHVDAEIFTEYSVLERLDHFSIDASLSLSFLAGLIKVSSIRPIIKPVLYQTENCTLHLRFLKN